MKDASKYLSDLVDLLEKKSNICPACKAQVDTLAQVGKCVYARPCNCRVMQGRVPEKWADQSKI